MKIEKILKQVLEVKGSAFFYTPAIYKNSRSFFFKKPVNVFSSKSKRTILDTIDKFNNSINKTTVGYCLINYEAGFCFEKKLFKKIKSTKSELFKGLIFPVSEYSEIKSRNIEFSACRKDFQISSFQPKVSKKKYFGDIRKIKKYIAEGDTYQVNYTIDADFKFKGDIICLFKVLVFNQSAKYIAFINNSDSIIISFSPELFLEINGKNISTRPMKGTAERGKSNSEDEHHKYDLMKSEKDLAENMMIVDMLRNDLGRISKYGSVKVKNLFEVEKYESLFQMVTTVKSELKPKLKLSQIIKNTFPCGSITGAPKIRTMEIISELENRERGIYTGCIGIVKKDESIFNIAIRTIKINHDCRSHIGIGSGIVWDSDPEKEYTETILKSRFLTNPVEEFEIFETMKCENGSIRNLNYHIDRMKKAADYFLFIFNEKKIITKLKKEIANPINNKDIRIRIRLNKWGKILTDISGIPQNPDGINAVISDRRISKENSFQYFKTTNRPLYNSEYNKFSQKGFFDVIFLNESNYVAEGAITNIFIRNGEQLLTPPVTAGILDGIERKIWLNENLDIREENLTLTDLLNSDEITLCNSLRGRLKVKRLYLNDMEFREF